MNAKAMPMNGSEQASLPKTVPADDCRADQLELF